MRRRRRRRRRGDRDAHVVSRTGRRDVRRDGAAWRRRRARERVEVGKERDPDAVGKQEGSREGAGVVERQLREAYTHPVVSASGLGRQARETRCDTHEGHAGLESGDDPRGGAVGFGVTARCIGSGETGRRGGAGEGGAGVGCGWVEEDEGGGAA
ncbi:hypothetical protein DMC30DRAFT_394605 [Rhodotorula diobovata]|uniref:Uncharacterized protein n=1 Tax=Rhodotorula diobovata TaxID=5288 RepID=A0A5C5FZE3_9BASI|nr:hypothetical protein DMC30DRAFT_394605 [Rhodotorula diobovata]